MDRGFFLHPNLGGRNSQAYKRAPYANMQKNANMAQNFNYTKVPLMPKYSKIPSHHS